MTTDHVTGSLLGTAVGDALGLPYEGLSSRRAARLFGQPDRYRLVFGRGMVSDDTEHSYMVAQALVSAGGDVERFQRNFSWRLRFWLLGLPAGTGLATARAILKLWLGFGPKHSGVYSAGNGPAMLASDFLQRLKDLLGQGSTELFDRIQQAITSVSKGERTGDYAKALGLGKGVTGYVLDTVPVALHAAFSYPDDLKSALVAVIECGGDTDTTAAITGGIVGARVGKAGIPADLLSGLRDWPLSVRRLEQAALDLRPYPQTANSRKIVFPFFALVWPRNLVFLGIVLFHGLRRLLPPY